MPFIVLGIGVISQKANVPGIGLLLPNIGGGIIILGLMLPFFTGRLQEQMKRLADKVMEVNRPDDTESADAPTSDG